jgi:hypothetical protein
MELDKHVSICCNWKRWSPFCKALYSMNSVPIKAAPFFTTISQRLAFHPLDVFSAFFLHFIRDIVLVN